MQLLKEWPPKRAIPLEKRKRESPEWFPDEDGRKKPRAENGLSRNSETINAVDKTRRASESSTLSHAQSPILKSPLSSPQIHPDRHILLDNHTAASHNGRLYPLSPLPRSPERLSDGEIGEAIESVKKGSQFTEVAKPRRGSFDGQKHPKPLRIDTDGALSSLDGSGAKPQMFSEAGKDEMDRQSKFNRNQRKPSSDSYRPPSNPQSRRESEIMLPPPSAGAGVPQSGNSTPHNTTPIISRAPTIASSKLRRPEHSTGIIASGREVSSSRQPTAQHQESVSPNFSSFAQAILATASANLKIETVNEKAIQLEKATKRQQRYGFCFDSLSDHTYSTLDSLEKSKDRHSKQLDGHLARQDSIASKLDDRSMQAPINQSATADVFNNPHVVEELEILRKDLARLKKDFDRFDGKCLRSSDLDGYAKKSDLEKYTRKSQGGKFLRREDVLGIEEEIAAHTLGQKTLEGKILDLAGVTGDRYHEAQSAQQHSNTRVQQLHVDIEEIRTKQACFQSEIATTVADLQPRQVGLEANLDTISASLELKQSNLEKALGVHDADFSPLTAKVKQLQDEMDDVKLFVNSDSKHSNYSLRKSIEVNSDKISQMDDLIEQLRTKAANLEAEKALPLRQTSPSGLSEDYSILRKELETLRQDLEALPEEQKAEYNILADAIENLELRVQQMKAEFAHFRDDVPPKPSPIVHAHALSPSQRSTPTKADDPNRVKIEKIENDLKALDTQFVVQKKQFDNLTTEHLAHSIIHQTKQLYKEHPGHVQDKLNILENRMNRVDNYISQSLEPRLGAMYQNINKSASDDALQSLTSKSQEMHNNAQENLKIAVNLQKDLSDLMRTLKADVASQRDLLDGTRHVVNRTVEDTTKRINELQGDIEHLRHAMDFEPSKGTSKQTSLNTTLKPQTSLKLAGKDTTGNPETEGPRGHFNSADLKETTSTDSTLSSRYESAASRRDTAIPSSGDESDIPARSKRKRRPRPSISDSEDNSDQHNKRKTVRRTEA